MNIDIDNIYYNHVLSNKQFSKSFINEIFEKSCPHPRTALTNYIKLKCLNAFTMASSFSLGQFGT